MGEGVIHEKRKQAAAAYEEKKRKEIRDVEFWSCKHRRLPFRGPESFGGWVEVRRALKVVGTKQENTQPFSTRKYKKMMTKAQKKGEEGLNSR
jgi:hypothetical protein